MIKNEILENQNQTLKKTVKAITKNQAFKIIHREIKSFSRNRIISTIRLIPHYQTNFKEDSLRATVFYCFKKEKETILQKRRRINSNKTVLNIKNKYEPVDVELTTFYLNLIGLLSFKTPKHYLYLEQIIKIVLGLEKDNNHNQAFKNYKYVKKIQETYILIDVFFLASYLNSIKGYTFRSKQEAEILEHLIMIILSIPIGIVNKINLKEWQHPIKLEMKEKEIKIREIIKKNLNI